MCFPRRRRINKQTNMDDFFFLPWIKKKKGCSNPHDSKGNSTHITRVLMQLSWLINTFIKMSLLESLNSHQASHAIIRGIVHSYPPSHKWWLREHGWWSQKTNHFGYQRQRVQSNIPQRTGLKCHTIYQGHFISMHSFWPS